MLWYFQRMFSVFTWKMVCYFQWHREANMARGPGPSAGLGLGWGERGRPLEGGTCFFSPCSLLVMRAWTASGASWLEGPPACPWLWLAQNWGTPEVVVIWQHYHFTTNLLLGAGLHIYLLGTMDPVRTVAIIIGECCEAGDTSWGRGKCLPQVYNISAILLVISLQPKEK